MNLISKILLEGLYSATDSIYDVDYYTKISPKQIRRKTYVLASKFGIKEVKQAKTGSCYFILFNPQNHFIYEVRVSNHPPINKNKFHQVIELTYSQNIDEMINVINKRLGNNNVSYN